MDWLVNFWVIVFILKEFAHCLLLSTKTYWIFMHIPFHTWSSKASQDEAVKQKEALGSEVAGLRVDLQQVREDRSRQSSLVQDLQAEVAKYNECTLKYTSALETLNTRTVELEVCYSVICSLKGLKCFLQWVYFIFPVNVFVSKWGNKKIKGTTHFCRKEVAGWWFGH